MLFQIIWFTVLTTSLFNTQETPVVMAVNITTRQSERCVGIAFVDMTKRQLGMTEFLDDDLYTSLESAMVALSCRECIIPMPTAAKSPDDRKLRDVMARCNVLVTEKKKSDFRYAVLLQSTAALASINNDHYYRRNACDNGLCASAGYTSEPSPT